MFVKKIYEIKLKNLINLIDKQLFSIRFSSKKMDNMYRYSISTGKRFRPLIVLLSCKAVGGDYKKIIPIACSFELLHKASLVHDDLIDEDGLRRGKKTFHKKYGEKEAVIMGDVLTSIAFDKLSKSRSLLSDDIFLRCHNKMIETYKNLSLGEMQEEILKESYEIGEERIYDMHYKKTASFIESCFEVGAILGRGSEEEINALAEYGKNIGLAFQIINDLNNLQGLESNIKSNQGDDLIHKRKNYLLVHTLNNSNKKEKTILKDLLLKKKLSDKDILNLINLINKKGSVDYSKAKIDSYLKKARDSISIIKKSPIRKLLLELTNESWDNWFWTS